MYQNEYVLTSISNQLMQERQAEARAARRVRLADLFRRQLRRNR